MWGWLFEDVGNVNSACSFHVLPVILSKGPWKVVHIPSPHSALLQGMTKNGSGNILVMYLSEDMDRNLHS